MTLCLATLCAGACGRSPPGQPAGTPATAAQANSTPSDEPVPAGETKQERASSNGPEMTIKGWASSFGNIDDVLQYYAESDDLFVKLRTGQELKGIAAVKELYQKGRSELSFMSKELSDLTVDEKNGKATVAARHAVEMRHLKYHTRWRIEVRTVFNLERQSGAWKIVREISTPIEGVPSMRPLRVPLDRFNVRLTLNIESVAPDGRLKVNRALALGGPGPEERYYYGLDNRRHPSKLFRVSVVEDRVNETVSVRVSPAAAAQLKLGDKIELGRPAGWQEAWLAALPDFVAVEDQSPRIEGLSREDAVRLDESQDHLKQIGIALHNWHDATGKLPPAVIHGPDGKPWHSWRVLLLPYLEQGELYKQYRFDEPWDGPNNLKLLAQVPPVYRDPIYGQSNDHFTHYAAVTGKGTAFPAEGVKTDDPKAWVGSRQPSGGDRGQKGAAQTTPPRSEGAPTGQTRIQDIVDGTSFTLLVGSVGPERKIPWTKPDDVLLDDAFPPPGKEGFAAPYAAKSGKAGVFLRADASTVAIRHDIDPPSWRNLFLINDRQPLDPEKIPTLSLPGPPEGMRREPMIDMEFVAGKLTARFAYLDTPEHPNR